MRGKGLGQKLINSLMDAARSKGLKIMEGEVISSSSSMLKFMARIGFTIETSTEDAGIKRVSKML